MTTKIRKSVKEAAQDVRDFLARSSRDRKENSRGLMQEIQERRKERAQNVRDFLAGSAARRTAVFKEVMKGIGTEVDKLAKETEGILHGRGLVKKEGTEGSRTALKKMARKKKRNN